MRGGRILLTTTLLAFIMTLTASATDIKLGTYNIRYAGAYGDSGWKDWSVRKEFVVKTITDYDYDIIGMNEVRTGVQLNYMIENLGSAYDYYLSNDEHGGYNPIFFKKDKFEMMDSGTFYLNSQDLTKPILSWDNSQGNYRFTGWTKLRVKATGEILFFFETHLDHQGETARNEQARINMEQIRCIAAGYPAIICGDHNASKTRIPFYNMKSAYMQDARQVATNKVNIDDGDGSFGKHKVDGRDFWDPNHKNGSRLDYIWVRGVDVDEYRTINDSFGHEETPSDHFAIQATITLQDIVPNHTLYVDPQGGDGDGTITNPFNDLQKAVDALIYPGDTILVKAGKLAIAGKNKTATIKITKTATIIGGYNNDFTEVVGLTELNGDLKGDDVYEDFAIKNTTDNLNRLITLNNTSALEIANFNLHGANAPQTSSMGQGAAIYCPGYRLKVENCWIHDNVSYSNGAGVYSAGALDIYNCKMNNNISQYGSGGAFFSNNYTGELYWRMSVKDSEFFGNKAKIGGAGYNGGFSWLCVTGCCFYNNKVSDSGIFDVVRTTYDANVAFANNTFANNILESTPNVALGDASKGGSAILVKLNSAGSNLVLVNNTIVGNSASCKSATATSNTFVGAAVQTISDCSVRLWNNIISGNTTTATTGSDVNLANPANAITHRNVFTSADDVNSSLTATDLYMSSRDKGMTALAKILDGTVVDGLFKASVTQEGNTQIVKVNDVSYGTSYINDVLDIDLDERVFIADVTHNAETFDAILYDQRGLERRQNGTSTRGAYEWGKYLPAKLVGDANADGTVDVSDITAIAAYILGNNPSPFDMQNADVDADGQITVADITGTAGIILK
ncbi:MAG: endonuclease/exonuclease/phosphatase family protein [Prevotellaceae bacterium]|nr:endonuclease/exonuclease/phosphatase family protein [Prevotellaceae bacterium]